MEKKLTITANIAIVIAVAAILVALARNDFLAHRRESVPGPMPRPTTLVGHQFPIVQAWASYPKTVVLALAVGCRFCSASAPFYRKLTAYAADRHVNVIALLPQAPEQSSDYVKGLGVAIPTIQRVNLEDIKVIGTPTLFVIDSKGVVQRVWEGQLRDSDQKDVFTSLG